MCEAKIKILPENVFKPFGNYSHGIFNKKTGLLVSSGQLGIDKNGYIPDSFIAQTELCFANIAEILKVARLDLDNIIRVNAFLTERENFKDYMVVRDRVFSDVSVKPASTLLIVSGFTRAEFLVEVEFIAQK